MWCTKIIFVVLTVQVISFFQKDYHLRPEHATLTWYNKDRLKYFNIHTFKYNRTTTAFNVDVNLIYSFSNNLIVDVEGFKFASNEYRPFPINFQFNFCAELRRNTFGMFTIMKKHSNTTLCPFAKGAYYVANFTIDELLFPPYIPNGRYKMTLHVTDNSIPLANMDVYGEAITIVHYRFEKNKNKTRKG